MYFLNLDRILFTNITRNFLSQSKQSKAILTLLPAAVERIRQLQSPESLLKVGIKHKGCSGSTYNFTYVKKPNSTDEIVEQDGVKIIVDSKALLAVIGSEVDFVKDDLSERFVFNNPNVKEFCGCKLSFTLTDNKSRS